MDETRVETARMPGAGVTLQVARAGPADGPLVVLLHGFPDVWRGWGRQIGPLAEAGFRVLVPNQRGYAGSDKPAGVAAYHLDRLAEDVVALIEAEGRAGAHLVGHDWGGLVAWWTAMRRPDRVRSLAVLNAPHPAVVGPYMRGHPSQILRSGYIGLFQVPLLPEALLRARDFALLRRTLMTTSRRGAFDEADIARYREAWGDPGALTAMLAWYRALPRLGRPADPRIRPPTLVMWGLRDAFLERGLAEASLELCDAGRPLWFERGSHWVHREEVPAVNAELVDHVRAAEA